MMRVLIDASAVLAVLLREKHRDAVLEASRDVVAVSPETLMFEVCNALSARMKRSGDARLDPETAKAAFSNFQRMEIELLPLRLHDHERALELAGLKGIYVYDAYILAAAQVHGLPILTLDGAGRRVGLRQVAQSLGLQLALEGD